MGSSSFFSDSLLGDHLFSVDCLFSAKQINEKEKRLNPL